MPYVWGRVVLARVEAGWLYSCIAVAATAAAVLGIIEFATGFNPFVGIGMPNGAWRTWHELQPGAASSAPRARSATRSPSRARWR